MPIQNTLKLIRDKTLNLKSPVFDINPEIIDWAKLHVDIWLQRWNSGTHPHWKTGEENNNRLGLIGHKCFEVALQELEVPYVSNDPTIDWRSKKAYDFRIPGVGTVEIKTVDFKTNLQRLIIKRSEWHDSDFVLALKVADEKPTSLQFVGYATREDVMQFNVADGKTPCPNAPCFWEFLEDLRPAKDFFAMLQQKTKGFWE
ncbi:MAG: hypothetical protein GX799_00085 [Crenarchaeota archaeon]|nr:hypothetical protein [Thermoproteota archaeon]